jgi:hypothetical protein
MLDDRGLAGFVNLTGTCGETETETGPKTDVSAGTPAVI